MLVRRDLLPRRLRLQLEQAAFRNARVPESYDIAVSDGHLLQSPCRRGVVSVLADGRYWHIGGGLVAPETVKPEMIQWLRQLSREFRKTIAVYNVPEDEAVRFQQAGFVVNKLGEEPIVDLGHIDWAGKPFEWVRRQTNFCQRAGLTVQEVVGKRNQQRLARSLLEITNDDLRDRTLDRPLKLLEGQFTPHALQRRRLFVARNERRGQVEAFLACSPMNGGREWAFETYRKRRDATRGATAFLFRSVIDQLQDEGADRASLCLVPGRGVTNDAVGNGYRHIEAALSLWFNRLDFLFNAKGQDHFKSRFRPRYESRYLCVAPGCSVGSFWSFLKVTGALKPNLPNMIRQLRRKPR